MTPSSHPPSRYRRDQPTSTNTDDEAETVSGPAHETPPPPAPTSTSSPSPTSTSTSAQRRDARATRARILDAARRELTRDPDSRLEDIAGAAGVARRTVYVHFAGRAALVEGLAAEAAEAIRRAVAGAPAPTPDAAADLARFVLTVWPVGDRYRTLIRLARGQDLAPARVDELLTLLDCVDRGLWSDDGTGAATAALIAAGVAPDTAAAKVDQVRKSGSPPSPV
jgi:AcrR family transcriptional regulator